MTAENPKSPRKPVSFRLSAEAIVLLEKLSVHLGIDKTSVIEMSVRDLARKRGLGNPK